MVLTKELNKDKGILDAYGFDRAPFSDAVDIPLFFPEASRLQRLHLLLHLAPFGEFLVLFGPEGSGKSCLLDQFVQRSHESWVICNVKSADSLTGEALLALLVETFLNHVSGEETGEQLIESLNRVFESMDQSSRPPVLVIDNAHHMHKSAWRLLLLLSEPRAEKRRIGILLSCECLTSTGLSEAELVKLKKNVSHSFELMPLSDEDTKDYVLHQVSVAGLQSEGPFSQAVLKVICGTSKGNPKKINELAQIVLRNSAVAYQQQVMAQQLKPAGKNLKKHIPAIFLGMVLILILFFQENINQFLLGEVTQKLGELEVDAQEVAEINNIPMGLDSKSNGSQSQLEPKPLPEEMQSDTQAILSEKNATLDQELIQPHQEAENGEMVVVESLTAEELAIEAPDTSALNIMTPIESSDPASVLSGSEQVLAVEKSIETDSMDRKIDDETLVITTDPNSQSQIDIAQKNQINTDLSQSEDIQQNIVQADESLGSTPSQMAVGEGEPRFEAKSENLTDDVVDPVLPENPYLKKQWVLGLNPSHYTLQLVARRNIEITKRYVDRHDLLQDAAIIATEKNGSPYFAVIYGDFAGYSKAVEAAALLKDRIKGVNPWVRPVKGVQKLLK